MGFTQLIKNAAAFIDIRKQLVTTVPGLLLAVGLVVLTGTAPAWVARPFACADVTPLKREAAANAETLRVWDSRRSVTGKSNEDLVRLRAEESAFRRQFQRAAIGVQTCDAKTCPQTLKALKTAAEELTAFLKEADGYRPPTRAAAKDEGEEAATADRAQETVFEANRKLAWLEVDPTCGAAPVGWDSIAADILMFGLLGFLLGLMLDPINKAVFLEILPETAVAEANAGRPAIGRYVAAAFVGKPRRTYRVALLTDKRVQFYIGRGVITESEYQALVDKYYRFAELTVGLVVPTLIAAIALFQFAWVRDRRGLAAMAALALVALAGVLARVGVHRHAEFREATADLIEGRLAKLKDEERVRKKTVDLLSLQQLITRAEKLLGARR